MCWRAADYLFAVDVTQCPRRAREPARLLDPRYPERGHGRFMRNGAYVEGDGFCAGAAAQDSGLTCQLILVLADGTADARFAAYNNSAPANGDPGLAASELRGTINLIASVDLTKKIAPNGDEFGAR